MTNEEKRILEKSLNIGEKVKENCSSDECIEYYEAVIQYMINNKKSNNPKITAMIDKLNEISINTTSETNDKTYEEDTVTTEKILKCKEENPTYSYRKIADLCECSKSKVGKVLARIKYDSTTNTIIKNKSYLSKRKLEELSDEELEKLLFDFKQGKNYGVLYKKFNLADRLLDNTLSDKIYNIKKDREREYRKQEANERLLNNDDNFYVNTNKAEYVKKTEECLPELESLW